MYLRFVHNPSEINCWLKFPKKEMELSTFGRKRDPKCYEKVSVFSPSTELEAAECAVAFLTTSRKDIPNHVLAIQIDDADLELLKIEAIKCNAKTGIKRVDELHYDLKGDQTKFLSLTRLIYKHHSPTNRRLSVLSVGALLAGGQSLQAAPGITEEEKAIIQKIVSGTTKYDLGVLD